MKTSAGQNYFSAGAAGSIGSELVEVSHYEPKLLNNFFDIAESPLYVCTARIQRTYSHCAIKVCFGRCQGIKKHGSMSF